MSHPRLINENQLDEWVRGNNRRAQEVIVELIWRLVAASAPKPIERRFPLGDSIGQHGQDGLLDTAVAFDPFVPEGRSFWEIGVGVDAGGKATSDYTSLTGAIPEAVRQESAFIFVTPLSGRRDWEHTWKEDAQGRWLATRKGQNDWRDVRVIDGTKIIDWLSHFPAVERWLYSAMGCRDGFDLPLDLWSDRWSDLRSIGEPPPLSPGLFLANRQDAEAKISDVFQANAQGAAAACKIDTRHPNQVADFVVACIAKLESEAQCEAASKILIVRSLDLLNTLTELSEPHIFVIDTDAEQADAPRFFAKAQKKRHSIIYASMPGGLPHGNTVVLSNPKSHQIKEALVSCGYGEARADALSHKCDNNIGKLLFLIQGLSVNPAWAQGSSAADLVILELLGSCHENNPADVRVVEDLSGKTFGEWSRVLGELLTQPSTPLTYRNGAWRMSARYEGWHSLGDRIRPKLLEQFRHCATSVLREISPAFDLPTDQRYLANIYGKTLTCSGALRHGLAETLALLGSCPQPLSHCVGKSETTANLAIREILKDADWKLWGTLNNLLPLLAEAAPSEFLNAVRAALRADPCPFRELFAQEGSGGFLGNNYLTGLWWALETLAWDPDYLVPTVSVLGDLAALDPGGNWSNRPGNSLSTIFLPWLPQTIASIDKRIIALRALQQENPAVAWKLLLALLPNRHSISSGSHKPTWRSTIPETWDGKTTHADYWRQVDGYSDMLIEMGMQDTTRLSSLIKELDHVPEAAMKKLLAYLRSDAVQQLPEPTREPFWSKLKEMTTKHKSYSDADWAWEPELTAEVDAVADLLAPADPLQKYRRIFTNSDFALFDREEEDYGEQQKKLDSWRADAAREIFDSGGVPAVLRFAETIEAANKFGSALASFAPQNVDDEILPRLLRSEKTPLALLASGLAWGRHRTLGWAWVDQLKLASWDLEDTVRLFAHLPFTKEAWGRAEQIFGEGVALFWKNISVRPYWGEDDLIYVVDRLLEHGRPHAAIHCLHLITHAKKPLDAPRAVKALLDSLTSEEPRGSMDVHESLELIKLLQERTDISEDDLFKIEWNYLAALDGHHGVRPKYLFHRLGEDAAFFCEVIQILYKSKIKKEEPEEPAEDRKAIAENAWKLLHEWDIVPGKKGEGFDPAHLREWIQEVTEKCRISGHLEVARSQIGHVLKYAPADPDGLWIHRAVADILNAKDADDLRDGFWFEHLNSRGCHWVDQTGGAERKLAEDWRAKAEAVENAGYPHLAEKVRSFVAYHIKEAERIVEENRHGDA